MVCTHCHSFLFVFHFHIWTFSQAYWLCKHIIIIIISMTTDILCSTRESDTIVVVTCTVHTVVLPVYMYQCQIWKQKILRENRTYVISVTQ